MKFLVPLVCIAAIHCATVSAPAEPQPPGYLGLTFTYHEPKGDVPGWMMIRHVIDDGPAYAAGVQSQMVVVAVNGRALDFNEDAGLLKLIGTIKPRDRVRLTLHDGKQLTIIAGVMPPDAVRRWKANFEPPNP